MVGTFEFQPPGKLAPRLRVRPGVRFGKPLDFSRYYGLQEDRIVLRAITDEIMYELMKLAGQEYVDEYAQRTKARRSARRKLDNEIAAGAGAGDSDGPIPAAANGAAPAPVPDGAASPGAASPGAASPGAASDWALRAVSDGEARAEGAEPVAMVSGVVSDPGSKLASGAASGAATGSGELPPRDAYGGQATGPDSDVGPSEGPKR